MSTRSSVPLPADRGAIGNLLLELRIRHGHTQSALVGAIAARSAGRADVKWYERVEAGKRRPSGRRCLPTMDYLDALVVSYADLGTPLSAAEILRLGAALGASRAEEVAA